MSALSRFLPMEIAVGADVSITLTLFDDDNDPLATSGGSAEWKLYRAVPRRARKPYKGTSVLSKTSAAGGITLAAGSATISIADTDLSGKSGEFWQRLTITDANGTVSHLGQGPVRLVDIG